MNHLDLYRVFQTVAEKGSFSAAAAKLYITQPAVSQAIKQLEEGLDTKLFLRRAKGVTLTGEGEMLLGYVNSALALLETGEQKLVDMKKMLFGELKIGAGDTVSKHFLLPYLERFHNLYPGIRLRVMNRTSAELMERLGQGGLDLAFVNQPMVSDGSLQMETCLLLEDIFVAGQKFAFLKGQTITRAQLAQYPLIMLEKAANSRRWVDREFLASGVLLAPEIELGAYDLLEEFARIGLGISCVTKEFTRFEPGGELFPIRLEEPLPRRRMGLCVNRRLQLSYAADTFIRWCKENMAFQAEF